jgi:phospholipid/cholesterol/gamma-HCH transport system substrate-binding protein
VVVVLIAVALYIASVAQKGLPFTPTTTVKAEISDIHTLAVNDEVRQDSKRIGRVSAIGYVNGKALVTMELDGHQHVYNDASAAVWDASTLAMKFVELDAGTPKAGELGDKVIAAQRTSGSADLQQLLAVLDPDTRAQAAGAVRELGGGIAGHSEDIHDFAAAAPNLLDDLGTTAGALASDQMDLPAVLQSARDLTSRLGGRQQQITTLMNQSDSTLRALTVENGQPLEDALAKAPATLRDVRGALDSLDAPLADLQTAMTTVRPGADALGQSTPGLRGLLREGVPVLDKVPGVADHANPAIDDLRQTIVDARPLAPRLTEALTDLATPLGVLAPYGPEIAQFFVRGHSFVSEGPAPGIRYARLSPNIDVTTVTGGLLPTGNYPIDQYPAPGQATGDRATRGLPPGLPPALPQKGGTR